MTVASLLLQGSASHLPLRDESVQCVVTSPPYWGLRQYAGEQREVWDGDPEHAHEWGDEATLTRRIRNGAHGGLHEEREVNTLPVHVDISAGVQCACGAWYGALGLEPTPELYVAHIVAIFREVRRVLRSDGTLWLNLGSSYAGGGQGGGGSFATERPGWSDFGGTSPTRSRQRPSAPAYGSGDTERLGSPDLDSACCDLCDGCLADFQTHLRRIARTDQPRGRSPLPDEQTGRDSARQGSAGASPGVSPLDAPVSTSLESWLQQRGQCSRCDSRASALSGARSSSRGVPVSVRNSWLKYTASLGPKQLVPIPWMVAMALQEDGWYLRSDIIWSKPNPMPESVTDRPTKAHEYLFLLSKSGETTGWRHRDGHWVRWPGEQPAPDYRWRDALAHGAETISEPPNWRTEVYAGDDGKEHRRWSRINLWAGFDYFYDADAIREKGATGSWDAMPPIGGVKHVTGNDNNTYSGNQPASDGRRNKRTVWTIATQPYAGAHFATFPEALVEPCVLAGSAPQACGVCGAPWGRVTEREFVGDGSSRANITGGDMPGAHGWEGTPRGTTTTTTNGWRPSCAHDDGSGHSVVLDPFAGSGTVGRVAIRHGRSYVGLDISREYLVEQAAKRTTDIQHAMNGI